MAIADEAQIETFTGNASSVTAYVIPFAYRATDDLVVTRIDADGVRTLLVETTDYVVTGQNLVTVAAIPITEELEVERDTPLTQDLDTESPAGSFITAIEGRLDRIVMGLQDMAGTVARNLGRSLRAPLGETAAELPAAASRAGKFLYFNATTGAFELLTAAGILALSGGAAAGVGIPDGGTRGQVLVKSSANDGEAEWQTVGSINVTDYGAVGNGTTDDSAAFQAALIAAAAAGKRVYVPMTATPSAGYVVGGVVVPRGTSIHGDGPMSGSDWTGPQAANRTVIKAKSGSTFVFATDLDTDPNEGFDFRRLDIRGGNGTSTVTTYGILFRYDGGSTYAGEVMNFRDCTIRGFQYGIYNDGGVHVSIIGCTLAQNTFGAFFTGATHTFRISDCNLGGRPVDGSNGVGVHVNGSNTMGVIVNCECGNMSHAFELGGTITVQGCNFESFDRRYAILIRDVGVITFIGNSWAGASIGLVDAAVAGATHGAFVRNNNAFGNVTSRTTFIGNYVRDGAVYYDGFQLAYESKIAGDRPVFIAQPGCGRTLDSGFTTVTETYSSRDTLAAARPVVTQRLDLAAAPVTGSGYAAANNGAAYANPSGLELISWTTANSSAVVNLSKGSVFSPVLARPGDATFTTVDWARRLAVRFQIGYLDQNGVPTSDDKFILRIGDPYNSTATGNLTDKGIGLLIEGTAVKVIAHDGATQVSASLGTLADGTLAEFTLVSDGAGNVKASMTGGSEVILAGAPTTEGTANANSITFAAWNTALSVAIPRRTVRDFEIAYY